MTINDWNLGMHRSQTPLLMYRTACEVPYMGARRPLLGTPSLHGRTSDLIKDSFTFLHGITSALIKDSFTQPRSHANYPINPLLGIIISPNLDITRNLHSSLFSLLYVIHCVWFRSLYDLYSRITYRQNFSSFSSEFQVTEFQQLSYDFPWSFITLDPPWA